MFIGSLISAKPKYRKRIELTGTLGAYMLADVQDRDKEIEKLNKYVGHNIYVSKGGLILILDSPIEYEEHAVLSEWSKVDALKTSVR